MPEMLANGRYELVEKLGQGDESVVYRAKDVAIARDVVLKRILALPGSARAARIEREARLYGAVNHPLIVRLYDVFASDREFVLVLEFLNGQDLRRVLASDTLRLEKIVRYAKDIVESLSYLHSREIIHRDVKPSNLIVRTDDRVVLADLGIGKSSAHEQDDAITATGAVIGTPAYMSPEQIRAEDVTPATDVFALGIVIYEMITGRLPFAGSTVHQRLLSTLNDAPSPILTLRPACPPTFARLVEAMLAKAPGGRPALERIGQALQELDDLDWHAISTRDRAVVEQAALTPRVDDALPAEVYRTQIPAGTAPARTRFFATDTSRYEEFTRSVQFYRSHLDSDYTTLLKQAKLAFALWLVCAGLAFGLVIAGVVLLYYGKVVPGTVTLLANAPVLILQRLFKLREDHYRSLAEAKTHHLELGNLWYLAIQSAEGLGDDATRANKLSAMIDALVSRVRGEYSGTVPPAGA